MNCASEAMLRAFVDNELPRSENESVFAHLGCCEECKQRAETISKDSREVTGWMRALASADDNTVDPKLAYVQYRAAVAGRKTAPTAARIRNWIRFPQLSVASAGLAVVLLLSFSPVRSWGQHFLQMLRVQKLAVIPVGNSAVVTGNDRALSQLISDSVVVTLKPGDPVIVPNAAAAAASVGFNVETLENLGAPEQVAIKDPLAFHMTLDTDKIRAVLEEVGRSDIQVPDSINGGTVAVHVPKGVHVWYGNCGAGAQKGTGDDSCVRFVQVPSPIVSVPPGLNMAAIAEAGLQLAGLSASEASNFAQTVDWSSTLVLPIPHDKASYRTIAVDGVNGTLIEWAPEARSHASYAIVWLKNGIVRCVTGNGNSAPGIAAVASLGS